MRRSVRAAVSVMSAMSVLAGCAQEADHDVAYYRAHASERAVRLARCRNDQGRVAVTSNCINALAAESEGTSRRFWTVQKPAARVSGARL